MSSEINDQQIASSIAALNESTGRVAQGFTLSGGKVPSIAPVSSKYGKVNANTAGTPPHTYTLQSPNETRLVAG